MAPKSATKQKANKISVDEPQSSPAASPGRPAASSRGGGDASCSFTPPCGPPMDLDLMRARWAKPTSSSGRIAYALWVNKLRSDFILGPYFFDWWESLAMYTFLLGMAILLCYGAMKQLHHAAEYVMPLVSEMMQPK